METKEHCKDCCHDMRCVEVYRKTQFCPVDKRKNMPISLMPKRYRISNTFFGNAVHTCGNNRVWKQTKNVSKASILNGFMYDNSITEVLNVR